MTQRHLDRLLTPQSVAVFGASDKPGRVGTTVWRNLVAGGFKGPVAPVNPRVQRLDGAPCYRDVAELPFTPDLAVLCTPPHGIAALVRQLGERGTRAVVIVTAGLSPQQKQAALDAARPHMLRLLGPNCIGLLSPHIGLNASFTQAAALPGELALVSQSGALVTALLDWANAERIGFSHLVSLGEHADVDFGDLLDHLATDSHTRAILLYVESISSPRKFMSAARAAARAKPVIIVKAGRAPAGMRAAASHTGALAGEDIVFDAVIRRAGMLRVDTLKDLFIAAETLARFRDNRSDELMVVTNGGGAGVMVADATAALGVTLARPGCALMQRLNAVLPANWSHANPIDIIGDAPVQRYVDALTALLAAPEAGALLVVHAPTAIVASEDIARACAPLIAARPGRVLSCWLGGETVAPARRIFEAAGIASYDTPEEAVRAFALMQTYRCNQVALRQTPSASSNAEPDRARARRVVDAALAAGREWLDEVDAKEVLAAYGIPVVATLRVAASPDAAADAARRIDGPVVLKVVSPAILHKSDAGGVRLDLHGEAAVRTAAQQMLAHLQATRPEARVEGFSVQAMVRRPHAQELIVGAHIDAIFGPVLLFGQGGTAVEVLGDRAVALPPLNRTLARDLIGRTRVARLLGGYRDHPPARIDALCDALIAVAQMQADLPELAELDINPLLADEQGVVALDARLRLSALAPSGVARFAVRPYPAEWDRPLYWQGQPLRMRPIRPEDEALHRTFLEACSPEDLRMRFFQAPHPLTHDDLARWTQIDYEREMAFVIVDEACADGPCSLGVARLVRDSDNIDAEFAVMVRSDLKRRGLGRVLMQALLGYAVARGTQRLVGHVLHENGAMLHLLASLGFERQAGHDQPDVITMSRRTA
ncbi:MULTISPECIES: bifunctional acetate--CoA ligase family protein/GNAT family N-acetyltransferase [unclassified Roseateles]|uniref:bifunctional acetate--CoA ligase family protein/GNAT family N-acetyltransferase n=1 Tax=unclassified Roseateles TaxID=2626991 RepID=UPI0006F2BFD3|nr:MULTISPECIES: bifunctional acetate--CoA ligase family protein/GNAT family N-acetyltransferase [unclassified Roseateles]KQW42502.1 GCN5 family acetyltransferase [Pelomonas sp. Root405]KRA68383.1 GCN5 family acetyltransferase [Pelomonas sp. Root662]